jgi:hypothetical protein
MGTNKGDYMKSGRDYSSIRSALDARARIYSCEAGNCSKWVSGKQLSSFELTPTSFKMFLVRLSLLSETLCWNFLT